MNKTIPEATAFPLESRVGEIVQTSGGLTKREYFAAMAMCRAFCREIITKEE